MKIKSKIFMALLGGACFAGGYIANKVASKKRNVCVGELHIYKLLPDQPEEFYASINCSIDELKRKKTACFKVLKGV